MPSTRPKLAQITLTSQEGEVNKAALAAQDPHNDASILKFITNEVSTYDLVYRLQRDDVYTAPIANYLEQEKFGTYLPYSIKKLFLREVRKFVIHKGILYTKPNEEGCIQLVVPLKLRPKIMETYHDSVFAAHQRAREMTANITKQYYWYGMSKDSTDYVAKCVTCQLVKRAHRGIVPPLGSHPETNTISEQWSLDFLERLKTSKDGFKHVVIAVEHVTQFVILEPLKTDRKSTRLNSSH